MATILDGIPLTSIPCPEGAGLYSVVQKDSGHAIVGNLEHVVEEFCGMSAYYPYTLDGQVHDDWVNHEHYFDDLLKVVLENPANFSIPDELRDYYGKQQLQIIDTFQKALLKAKPQTQADIAERIARAAHWGQRDKGRNPYISHLAWVARLMNSDEAAAVAWLHDVIEDTDTTLDDLRNAGLSEDVVEGVDACTRREGEEYLAFIRRAKENPIAREVKTEDVLDNINLSRIDSWGETRIDTDDLARVRDKYLPALAILLDIEGE